MAPDSNTMPTPTENLHVNHVLSALVTGGVDIFFFHAHCLASPCPLAFWHDFDSDLTVFKLDFRF